MTKHANCVVSIMFAKIVRVAAVAPVPALADPRPAAVSSQKVNPLVARWEPMQRIRALAHHVAMHARPSVKNVPTTQAHATTVSATAPKLLVRREVTLTRQIYEPLMLAVDLVRNDVGKDTPLAGHKVRGQRLSLTSAFDRLAGSTAREKHSIRVVENDHRLPALLDESASTDRVVHATWF